MKSYIPTFEDFLNEGREEELAKIEQDINMIMHSKISQSEKDRKIVSLEKTYRSKGGKKTLGDIEKMTESLVTEGKIGDKLIAKFTKETGINVWDEVKWKDHPGKWIVTRLWAPKDLGGMNPGLEIELTKGNTVAHWMVMDDSGKLRDSVKNIKKI